MLSRLYIRVVMRTTLLCPLWGPGGSTLVGPFGALVGGPLWAHFIGIVMEARLVLDWGGGRGLGGPLT